MKTSFCVQLIDNVPYPDGPVDPVSICSIFDVSTGLGPNVPPLALPAVSKPPEKETEKETENQKKGRERQRQGVSGHRVESIEYTCTCTCRCTYNSYDAHSSLFQFLVQLVKMAMLQCIPPFQDLLILLKFQVKQDLIIEIAVSEV